MMDQRTSTVISPSIADDHTAILLEKPSLRGVFDAEESALLRFAFGVVAHRETAEDLVQEAFLRLHEHWNEVENPRAWLYRSIRNMALNHLRDHKRETAMEEGREWASESLTADEVLGRHEAVGVLRMLMAELPAQDQQLILWKYSGSLSYEEISKRSGLSVSNVGYKLHHLLKGLADAMRRMGVESRQG
ncbi:MAG: RNA polymerase sigma factor [Akkermansiaceae bacterium]|jgi:RNA polymerase sigma-70 factor (ECF subfamily)